VIHVSSIDIGRIPQEPQPPGISAAEPTARPAAGDPGPRLSRAERVGLILHRDLDRLLTPFAIWVMRRTRGEVARRWKVDALLLTTRGRRSGRERTVALQYFPDGDAMVITAANDGGTSHPGWYFNLRGDPAARVEVRGRTIAVQAQELGADAAADWWQRIVGRDANYERYARATSRRFPILRLVPTSERSTDAAAQSTRV
jgi:deazaflavin-dependent oxidoreductase (nitroreductase family)